MPQITAMQLRLLSVFLVSILGLSSLFGQTKLTGKVLNAVNQPIAGVSIRVVGTQTGTSSDVEGRYALSLETGKKYELEFSASGFVSKKINDIEVGPGLDNELNVVLEIAVKNMGEVVIKSTSRNI